MNSFNPDIQAQQLTAAILLSHGADPSHRTEESFNQGVSILDWAAGFADSRLIGILLHAGAAVNQQGGTEDRTALMHAIQWNNLQNTTYLLNHGANPKLKDRCGKTAFDLAEEAGIQGLLPAIH